MLKKKITIFYIVVTIFILDRLSKYIILELSNPIGKLNVPITSFLNFDLIWNNGIAFGLFSFNEVLYYNLITLIIINHTSHLSPRLSPVCVSLPGLPLHVPCGRGGAWPCRNRSRLRFYGV